MEKLLTEEQLDKIGIKAKYEFEKYHNSYVIDGGDQTETKIITISKLKHLIFVNGNNDTGFTHLNERHSYFSDKNYWKLNDTKEYKLDYPSKFRPEMIPIVDYVKIADQIFIEENKNITKNNKPDLFDKYTGHYCYLGNANEKYHLLTYKDTKIVHTFFPDKKKHNPKTKCKFGRGLVSSTTKYPEGFNDLLLPFENEKGIISFSLLIRKYYLEKKERIIIQRHSSEGHPIEQFIFGERDFIDYESFEREDMQALQYGDIAEFEKIINDLDKNNRHVA
jgi:hypothetical protein